MIGIPGIEELLLLRTPSTTIKPVVEVDLTLDTVTTIVVGSMTETGTLTGTVKPTGTEIVTTIVIVLDLWVAWLVVTWTGTDALMNEIGTTLAVQLVVNSVMNLRDAMTTVHLLLALLSLLLQLQDRMIAEIANVLVLLQIPVQLGL